MNKPNRIVDRGFSLIELMIALVIAGVLAAIAYPAYTSNVQRSRRADALAALTAVMQAQERYRSNVNNYASSLVDLNLDISQITPHYQVALSGVDTPPRLDIGYVAVATPVSGGKQAGDSACKTLKMTLRGATPKFTATGDPFNSGADSDTTSICWMK